MVPATLLKTIPGVQDENDLLYIYCQAKDDSHDRVIPAVHVMHSFALIKLKHHQHCRIKITRFSRSFIPLLL